MSHKFCTRWLLGPGRGVFAAPSALWGAGEGSQMGLWLDNQQSCSAVGWK